MSDKSLMSALHKPRTLDEQLDSIIQVPLISALARIKVIAANKDGYSPDQVLAIFEVALTREVRTNPQRRAVIQALKQAIKRVTPKPAATDIAVEVVTDEPALSLATIVRVDIQEINLLHQQATGAAEAARIKAEEASHFALLAGTRLEQLREATPHGEWGTLFSGRKNPNSAQIGECAEFEFSQDTAARYIEVAKRIRLERGMSGKAQKQLATIASAPELDDSARDFLNKLTKGQSLRQLYLDLDIITAPAKADKPAKQEQAAKPKKSDAQAKLEDAREWSHTWQTSFDKQVKIGGLDDLDRDGLLALKEFLAIARDKVNARLK